MLTITSTVAVSADYPSSNLNLRTGVNEVVAHRTVYDNDVLLRIYYSRLRF